MPLLQLKRFTPLFPEDVPTSLSQPPSSSSSRLLGIPSGLLGLKRPTQDIGSQYGRGLNFMSPPLQLLYIPIRVYSYPLAAKERALGAGSPHEEMRRQLHYPEVSLGLSTSQRISIPR